ncbi:MAG TPA: amino acid adenylation domain-containing protein [Pyrinomonadaceae bacterium]|jgi:amino acid adenylation domain-containing protein
MSAKNIEDVYPLSPMQEGLLFHSLYSPGDGLYVTQFPYNCAGINVEALRGAWQRVIDRHPIFRTAFVWKNADKPLQVVGRRAELPFEVVDWRGLSVTEQDARFDAHLAEDRRRGFQLNRAPLLRVSLFQTGEDSYKFLLSHHHLLMDGWSTSLVFKEAFALYAALCEGREPESGPARPFKNYIAWLQRQDAAAAESFWREHLKGFTAPTPLVLDRVPGRALSTEESYAEEFAVLSPETVTALQALARRNQLTINTVVQGAWALLLSRYSGERDVAFGAVVSGRSSPLDGVESMVGLFINNLLTRVRVTPDAPVLDWLKGLQEQQVEARQFEHTPLSRVHAWSEVPNGERLFESILSFQNFPVSASLAGAARQFESIHTIEQSAYPLTLVCSLGEELHISVRYDRRSFDQPTAARIAGHLQTLLEAVVAEPARAISRLPFVTAPERELLLTDWSHTPSPAAPRSCVHELFEEQAALTPDAVAVEFMSERVTYAELNARANRLARHLRESGVGAETAVGLCVERSSELIVAMLGVLKAGGAYVPLDPQYPIERLTYMLADAGINVLVTRKAFLDAVPAYDGRAVCLDADAELIGARDAANLPCVTTRESLAYVMYTSGSTGRPKGVSVPHRGIVRLVRETAYAGFTSDEVFLQLAPASFDASTFEIWGALLNGGRLVVMPPHQPSLSEIGEAIRAAGVTTLWLTSGLFNLMVDERLEDLKTLRQLLAGGDVLSAAHVEKFLAAAEGCRLINGYGPTENTTFTCCHTVAAGAVEGSVPVGRPIAHTQVYVLDEAFEPVPVGVAGELYVGGAGLARGYANAPALTAEKFVPHPHAAEPGARLYKTGDRVRFLPDGCIEFLGRNDRQVKVRGFRVELGEIESALGRHEAVREVAVVARSAGELGVKQLVAYVVVADGQTATPAALRAHARELLPEHMAPAAFVLLDRFPLTPNGKLDLKALPAPEGTEREPEEAYVAPRNAVEETIAGLWSQLLGAETVGVADNFFALGGNSIFAIQLLSRLNRAFGLELPLRLVYDSPTVAGLAGAVVEAQAAQADEAELARLLAELEELSEDEARTLLAGGAGRD